MLLLLLQVVGSVGEAVGGVESLEVWVQDDRVGSAAERKRRRQGAAHEAGVRRQRRRLGRPVALAAFDDLHQVVGRLGRRRSSFEGRLEDGRVGLTFDRRVVASDAGPRPVLDALVLAACAVVVAVACGVVRLVKARVLVAAAAVHERRGRLAAFGPVRRQRRVHDAMVLVGVVRGTRLLVLVIHLLVLVLVLVLMMMLVLVVVGRR